MYVVATAGHVDHGKSTLVRALTGMEPDRWAEERRRGMTIDLGFAWADLPHDETVAFVDVPGHERFVPNMLAGVGPVPAVLFVVAADEGWMPQSTEHLSALNALDVRHGVLAVTRSDRSDPDSATRSALAQLARSSLGHVEAVAVSGVTGDGLPALRAALSRMVARLPVPDGDAPVRLWIDRCFSIRGSGTVVTGTLGAGTIYVGDRLQVGSTGHHVGVRGLQLLGHATKEVSAVARVAVNLRGIDADNIHRGDTLLTPGQFNGRDCIDVRVHGDPSSRLPSTVMFHIGAAAVSAQVRPLGADTARLTLRQGLPLRISDRGLIRDPGLHRVIGGTTVLDVAPPSLRRRGAAIARAASLASLDGRPDELDELRRRGIVPRDELERMGVPVTLRPVAGTWLVDADLWTSLRSQLPAVVADWVQHHPLDVGPPVDVVRRTLELPDLALVSALVTPPMVVQQGRICRQHSDSALTPSVEAAIERLREQLVGEPFAAPDAARLAELNLGPREIAAAARAGALLRVAEGVVLLPGSAERASAVLAELSQPFTVSEAKQALGTTRRVAVPLLELLDRRGATDRLPDDRRRTRTSFAGLPTGPAREATAPDAT